MVAATGAAVTLTCRPEPGLGSVSYTRAGRRHVVDLATCRERVSRAPAARPVAALRSPDGTKSALIVATRSGSHGTQAIVVRDNRTEARHRILVVRESYERIPAGAPGPLGVVDWSPDGDRLATNNKRLLVASAPDWKPRVLVPAAGRAWGSLTGAARSSSSRSRSATTSRSPTRTGRSGASASTAQLGG